MLLNLCFIVSKPNKIRFSFVVVVNIVVVVVAAIFNVVIAFVITAVVISVVVVVFVMSSFNVFVDGSISRSGVAF